MQLSLGDPRFPLVEYTVKLSECHSLPQSLTLIIFLRQEQCDFRATETFPTRQASSDEGCPQEKSLIKGPSLNKYKPWACLRHC